MSAIMASNLNMTPQQDPQNGNQLNLTVPPPTSDARQAVSAEAKKAADDADSAIKNARAAQHKKLRAAQTSKAARPDDVKSASTAMEKIVAKGHSDVQDTLKAARKVLDSA